MALQTRPPTGKIPPPVILIEGDEGAGKSWLTAQFTACPRVGRCLWLQVGRETTADEYGAIPGANYEIVLHDGTWHSIYGQVCDAWDEAAKARAAGDKPYVLTLDQAGGIWDLLCEWAHNRAKTRRKNKELLAADPNAEIKVDPGLWTDAGQRWGKLMNKLLTFPGIVIILSRGRETVAIDEHGKPIEGRKDYRVEGRQGLTFDVPVWIRMTRGGTPQLIKLRSVKHGIRPEKDRPKPLPGFTLEKLIFDFLEYDPAEATERGLVEMQAGDDAPESPRFVAYMAALEMESDEPALKRMWDSVAEALNNGDVTEPEAQRVREAIRQAKARLDAAASTTASNGSGSTAGGPTEQQHRRMHALWHQVGLSGDKHRDDRLAQTSLIVGRDIDSSAQLTPAEADKVIAVLAEQASQQTAEVAG